MISGLCGFAALVRSEGGDVGPAELIDSARALALVDLTDREQVRSALALTLSWSGVHPELFDDLFERWFSGTPLEQALQGADPPPATDQPMVDLDAETVDAAAIHVDDAVALSTNEATSNDADATTSGDRRPSPTRAPVVPGDDDGLVMAAEGTPADAPPGDADDAAIGGDDDAVVALPSAPPAVELELARRALAAAVEQRRRLEVRGVARRVQAVSEPLTGSERTEIAKTVRRLNRELDGAPSWRRRRQNNGVIDLRRTMRRTVTTGGIPIEPLHTGRRTSAARLVVLVDLSMSVRGTARLVLHLVHRMRAGVGAIKTYGFVDSCVPIDRALRTADPGAAIERVLRLVDVDASSDPGLALRQWWARSQSVVTPDTHVMFFGDGRCNGRDPAYGIVERATRRSASTLWISPEPEGAWTLGRGEMAAYATRVDRAITVRSIGDLDGIVADVPGRRRRYSGQQAWRDLGHQ
ncbi:MAG: VWA domain-containing protein [Actinomycetota bacterium]